MLTFGDRSIDVTILQEWLISIGFLDKKEPYYGTKTISAVRDLQTLLGLSVTGDYDPQIKILYDLRSLELDEFSLSPDSGTENSTDQSKFNDSYLLNQQKIPCYLVNLATNDNKNSGVVFFPHIPEDFSYTKGNTFEEQTTMGRSEPFQGYSGSTALTTTVSLTLSADYAPNHDLDSVLTKLEAFAYPRYGVSVRPPKCFFRCATFTLEGVLTDISITRKLPIINGQYSQAEVSLSLTETNPTSVSAKTVQDSPYRNFR